MIITITRCFNEIKNIDRFMRGYSFSDLIIVSDGGSTDGSYDLLQKYRYKNVITFQYQNQVDLNGEKWNPDNPHIQFIIDQAKVYNPEWIILDDMDDVPNQLLRENAKDIIRNCDKPQINAFRLYMWGDKQYFPQMNNNFDPDYKSLWAWKPSQVDIRTDMNQHHGTILGVTENNLGLDTPYCLLHKSWNPDTIQAKIDRYGKIGIDMSHPLDFAGTPIDLPAWAYE
jgi:glycosyltransferase involved in cell wall biosynthesis